MHKTISVAVIFLIMTLFANAQPNWEKIDLTIGGQVTILSNISGLTQKNDSMCYVRSSVSYGIKFISNTLLEINLITGDTRIIDTSSIKIYTIFYKKPNLYGLGNNRWQFNFTTNKWDSLNDFWLSNYNRNQKFYANISSDTVLLFGKKIEKFRITTNTGKIVCDSSILSGGIITPKNYYTLYQTITSLTKNYDSVFLLVSTDKGEHWKIRKRLIGNYDDRPVLTFVNSDTGYISYNTKAGSPPGQRFCHVLRTRDGGLTWPDTIKYFQQVFGSLQGDVYEIYFLDNSVGFVSYGTSIFKTVDGGNIWYETQGVWTDGTKMYFINDTIGYATAGRFFPGNQPYILKTTNQGGPPFKKVGSVGINNLEAAVSNAKVYPNPNNGDFTVSTPGLTIIGIKVYDNNSKLIFDEVYTDELQIQKINLPEIAKGIYYVHINTKEIKTVFTKFVVQ